MRRVASRPVSGTGSQGDADGERDGATSDDGALTYDEVTLAP